MSAAARMTLTISSKTLKKTKPFTEKIVKTGRRLGRPDILFWTLPWLMFLVFVGTIGQKEIGLHDAQAKFFSSFYWTWSFIPLPGGMLTLIVMSVNMMAKFLFLSPWSRGTIGINISHLSIIVLLVGGLITSLTMSEGFIALKYGQTKNEIMAFADDKAQGVMSNLPFYIKLNRFQRDVYPGTNMPRDYQSRVTIIDGDVEWPAIIAMNEPLRYRGYTFYQSSTAVTKDGAEFSILSVVENKGMVFPYISGVLMLIGLAYQVIYRWRGSVL